MAPGRHVDARPFERHEPMPEFKVALADGKVAKGVALGACKAFDALSRAGKCTAQFLRAFVVRAFELAALDASRARIAEAQRIFGDRGVAAGAHSFENWAYVDLIARR